MGVLKYSENVLKQLINSSVMEKQGVHGHIKKQGTLPWRHNGRPSVSSASRLFNQLFVQAQIRENIKAPCHWSLWGASNTENVSIWWRHHENVIIPLINKCTMEKQSHDDVIKWKRFPRNWPFVREIHRSPVNFPHKGQWRGALMFSLIYAWINDWVNNHEAGDLRRQHGIMTPS